MDITRPTTAALSDIHVVRLDVEYRTYGRLLGAVQLVQLELLILQPHKSLQAWAMEDGMLQVHFIEETFIKDEGDYKLAKECLENL